MSQNFIDYVNIYCKSGNGGSGSVHFRREKFVDKGGPDGGDGGRGGHIILKGNSQLWTLLHLKYTKHIKAENGKPGGKSRSSGAQGKNITVEVPLGTIAKNSETGEVLAEITENGQELILFEGGMGGLGNFHFKNSVQQTPRYAQPGIRGQEAWVNFELKVLADVGLVGFPNAGKSTLLSVISAAKPEIGAYPFTTITPNLGVVSVYEEKSFIAADIPGIIEGAAEGKGLGHRFLRHIERNSLLLFLISSESKNFKEEYETLLNELDLYNPELLDKKRIIGISKSDLLETKEIKKLSKSLPKNIPHLLFSSLTLEGIDELKKLLWDELSK